MIGEVSSVQGGRMRFVVLTALVACYTVGAIGFFAPVFAQQSSKVTQSAAFAPLDGQQFDAGIVRLDDATVAAPLIDRLFFANGTFSSKICERYGFVPGAYWVRGTANEIEFTAVLHSPTNGMMEWRGTVKDGRLDGTMRWTRERWYWTIDAEHRILGELVTKPSAMTGPD